MAISERRQSAGAPRTEPHIKQIEQEHRASLTPRRTARFLILIVLTLTTFCLLGQLALHFLPDFVLRDRFAATFNLDEEGNIPTLYSTLAILGCAVLLRIIARVERETGGGWPRQWTFMSLIFLGLAVDEFLSLHEEINSRLDLSGFTQWSWVAVGIVFVIAVAVIFFPVIVQLPSPIRRLFILAALIYLSGVIAMETVGGHYVLVWGHDSLIYALCTIAEEFFEMMGVVVFIYALLSYLTQDGMKVVLSCEVRAVRPGWEVSAHGLRRPAPRST